MAVTFVNDDLPIAIAEVVAKYLLPSPILLNVESMVGIGYGSRSTNTILRVLLKFATTRIFPFFLRTAKTGLLNPLGSLQGSITPSLAMWAISASTSSSSAWAIGCCFWLLDWPLVGIRMGLMKVPLLLSSVPRMSAYLMSKSAVASNSLRL